MAIQKLIEAIEKKKSIPEFSKLDAMQMLDVAWGKVTIKTVVNCFTVLKKLEFKKKTI